MQKADLENLTHVDTSSFALKVYVPTDLSKLSKVVKNDIFKKLCMINWLQK